MFDRKKKSRLEALDKILSPYSPGEVDSLRELHVAGELSPLGVLRLRFVEESGREIVEIRETLEKERFFLRLEAEREIASEKIRATLEDPKFLAACEKAGIPPTRRQASKWNIGRRGAALRAAGRIPSRSRRAA